ncbi:unnamed protein product [Gadus morhua 'NCC']
MRAMCSGQNSLTGAMRLRILQSGRWTGRYGAPFPYPRPPPGRRNGKPARRARGTLLMDPRTDRDLQMTPDQH